MFVPSLLTVSHTYSVLRASSTAQTHTVFAFRVLPALSTLMQVRRDARVALPPFFTALVSMCVHARIRVCIHVSTEAHAVTFPPSPARVTKHLPAGL
jgi:hypothetical protein